MSKTKGTAKTAAKTKKAPKKKAEETATEAPKPETAAAEAATTPQGEGKTEISFSGGLAPFLAQQGFSLAFTSYQTGKLYLIGHESEKKLSLHEAVYPQAMGVVGNSERLYLGTHTQIVRLENTLNPGQVANGKFDKLYVPRNLQSTGAVDIHELGIRKTGQIVFVNTKFNCLAEPSLKHSFKAVWKPAFISDIVGEDRCHLNGMAMRDGQPRYVTAVCKSDVVDGWRDRRSDGGIVIDVTTDEILAEGLSMPHSPRWQDGKLWVLNSGSGELGYIDEAKKSFVPYMFFPGFLRGLSFHGNYAMVTISKPRYKRFEGLELDSKLAEKDAEPWCGVQIVDLSTKTVKHWVRFDGHIQELFDVCALPGVKNPLTIAPNSPEMQTFITYENGIQAA